jgi:uncharacterized membrane protein YphA (DoxX/SURF4 family)
MEEVNPLCAKSHTRCARLTTAKERRASDFVINLTVFLAATIIILVTANKALKGMLLASLSFYFFWRDNVFALLIILQLLLSSVFVLSSISKLISRYSFMETLSEIGLNARYIPLVSLLFPLAELLTGVLLLLEPARWIGQFIMLCMLIGFAVLSIRAMSSKNNEINCSCFGELVRESLGMSTLVRSVVLMLCLVPLFMFREPTGLFELGPADLMAAWFGVKTD